MILTDEQQQIFDKVDSTLKSKFDTNVVIHVDAKAGTGKTALIKYIVEHNPKKRFIYTAFNKRIVEDGIETFGEDNCKTFHALAYKYTHSPKIGGFYPYTVVETEFTYMDKKLVVDMLDKYCLSRHLYLVDFHKEHPVAPRIEKAIEKYLDLMFYKKIPITFNYMLKELHHRLADGDIRIALDILFVDEAQDLTPVMLEIFGLIRADVKIYLGDACQDIYSFLDLVSAFTLSKSTYNLTTSFRLSPAIAARIEPFCQKFIDPSFRIVGVGTGIDTTEAFITHSNAEIIQHVSTRQGLGLTYSFTRPIKEIFEVAIAVDEILQGHKSKKPKYWALVYKIKKGYTPKQLTKAEDLDDDIVNSINLILHLQKKGIDIIEVLDKAESDRPNRAYLIGTAHSVKGTEFGKVTISNGLNNYVEKLIRSTPMSQEETDAIVEGCKLYYVACSRAKHTLINANLLTAK